MVAGRKLISITALLLVSGLLAVLVFTSCAELRTPVPTPSSGSGPTPPPSGTPNPPPEGREMVTIKGETFTLELSNNNITRQAGLMHRETIPDDGGMLFVFPDAQRRSFWMAYCVVDMDLMFLDARGRVTAAHRMKVQPPQRPDESRFAYEQRMRATDYGSRSAAQFAIELKAGSFDRLQIKVEDLIDLDLPRLKAAAQ